METNSHPEAAASTVKQGQYSPRKRKDTAPKVNPQLAIELFFQEMGRIEAYTKRIEDAYCSLVSCAIFGRMQPKTGTTTSSIMNTSKSRQGNKRETNKL